MSNFTYDTVTFPVREDLPAAYREYWRKLSSPGSWWTGAQRVAIAQEVRNALSCDFCVSRKQALSPYNHPGTHTHSPGLPDEAVDAVHRIITDQGRITQDWINTNIDKGLSEEAYVELVGIAVTVFSIDEFSRALGAPLEPLPEPLAGEPDHYRPAAASRGTGFVAMLPPRGKFSERENDLWPQGRTANVLRALSLVPDAVRDWQGVADAQYLPAKELIRFDIATNRSINRLQVELVAGRVSSINECFY
jgi:hypothetical protein